MSYVKIWIHAVWTVKNRQALLSENERKILFDHIHNNALEKEILMEIVNGHSNHVHCLFRLKNNQSVDWVMQMIKGESSFWFNKRGLSKLKLSWQKEYFAVSVSESQVRKVVDYISGQEEHHKKKTWEEEYNEFIKNYGFKIING
jgi:REP element-mobilizing transposase RayT